MWIIYRIEELPPLIRYLVYATVLAVLAFLVNGIMPKREEKQFDAMLLVRYLALGFIFGGVLYALWYHHDLVHV